MKIPVVLFVVLFVAGCATEKRYYPLADSGKRYYPAANRAPAATAAPQYEDPFVTEMRIKALRVVVARKKWQAGCLAMRQIDPFMTYDACRRVPELGDDRQIENEIYQGRRWGW